MNKKFLFAAMSLAALTACSTDDFESQQQVAEKVSPIQFEVVNGNDVTRASMNDDGYGNKIQWSAASGDLFTLYHGGNPGSNSGSNTPITLTGYENATYKATAEDGSAATLTTPSMIKGGSAIMVWPVDTTFVNDGSATPVIKIDADQKKDVANYIPYVSDVINIGNYDATAPYNTKGYNRKYPVYMRQMASQLNLKATYDGTATLDGLVASEGIDPIKVTSVELLTSATGNTKFTTKIPLVFTAKTTDDDTRWNTTAATKVPNNAWTHVTSFDDPDQATQVAKLTTKCLLKNNEGCKFLMLPQADVANTDTDPGVEDAAVVVNTTYGKVVVAPNGTQEGKYGTNEIKDAWYRYTKTNTNSDPLSNGESRADTKTGDLGYKTSANVAKGMAQVINTFNSHKQSSGVAATEPAGAAATRYVKVLLKYLDMSDLHVTSDKQLRDAALVWKALNLADVTVILDGEKDKNDHNTKEFKISQETITKINEINAAVTGGTKSFKVKPCTKDDDEKCETIVITGGGDIQDLSFIKKNTVSSTDYFAAVALNAGETWNWNGTNTAATATAADKVIKVGDGVNKIINRGTMVNSATATLAIYNADATQIFTVPFENAKGAEWNITTGTTLNVQFNVTNYGTVNIKAGAQYRQDGTAGNTTFTNEATTLPKDFLADPTTEKVGKVNNSGVFAVVSNSAGTKLGKIINYGLIEHETANAKTYITENQTTNAKFADPFSITTNTVNKMGRINLKYDNRGEDNVSISATDATGFVSVTVDANSNIDNGELKATAHELGTYVNYIIVKGGVQTISSLNAQYKYVEINQPGTEIAWTTGSTSSYEGLIVLSDVNITIGTTVTAKGTYLGTSGTMYVGGVFNKADIPNTSITATSWNAYYGNTADNVATHYVNTGAN